MSYAAVSTNFPPGLEDMSQHMLAKVDLRHRQEGLRLLEICYDNGLGVQKGNGGWIYALGLALVDDDYHSMGQVCLLPLNAGDKRALCEELEVRLRSRCGGLLKLIMPKSASSNQHCLCGEAPHDPWVDAKVVFMHRTLFEFISQEGIWRLEVLKPKDDDGFNLLAALSLHSPHLAAQCLSLRPPLIIPAFIDFCRGLQYGLQCDEERPNGPGNFFENLQPFFDAPGRMQANYYTFTLVEETSLHYSTHNAELGSYLILIIAAEAGAVNYVKKHNLLRVAATHDQESCGCLSNLFHATTKRILKKEFPQTLYTKSPVRFFNRDMPDVLLANGCDPN